MKRFKTIDADILLKQQLEDENFKKEYTAMEGEFELAREVIRLRKKAKLTQKQLADMAGTSQPAVARLESGEYKNLSLMFLRKIGKVLGVIPEVHFKEVGSKG